MTGMTQPLKESLLLEASLEVPCWQMFVLRSWDKQTRCWCRTSVIPEAEEPKFQAQWGEEEQEEGRKKEGEEQAGGGGGSSGGNHTG